MDKETTDRLKAEVREHYETANFAARALGLNFARPTLERLLASLELVRGKGMDTTLRDIAEIEATFTGYDEEE